LNARLERLRHWIARRLLAGHWPPLVALSLLHVAVTERALRGSGGIPVNTIPYDFMDTYSRFVVFISDSLSAGALPLWYPYGHAGIPFFANPQSQMWSPVTWIMAGLFKYDLLTVQRQVFLTILGGSFGVYFLAHTLWRKRAAALLSAIAFNFTSARLCNAEHMDIVTAFSLFPWIFWGMRRLADGDRWAAPLLGMALGLLVVSGYPGVVLLSPLWFGGWAGWLLSTSCADRASRMAFLARMGLSLALGVGISAGYCLSIAGSINTFSRGEPLSTEASLIQGLVPADLWHLIFGASTVLPAAGAAADISMRGLYFGIVALVLAFYAVLANRKPVVTFLGIGFLVALLMSMGRAFFARVALHDLLPLFNFSRFPAADSRAVAALAGCLLAGGGLAALLDAPHDTRRFSRLLVATLGILAAGLIWLKGFIYPTATPAQLADFFDKVVIVEMLIVSVTWLGLARFSTTRAMVVTILIASALDSGMHASAVSDLWSVPSGARGEQYRAIHTRAFDPAKALVPRVDFPSLIDPRSNDAYLNKSFYLSSYTPFQLKSIGPLASGEFRNFLVNGKRVVGFTTEAPPRQGNLFEQKALAIDFRIQRYLPDRVDYVVNLPTRTTLVFNEMYFPGWRARIDGGATVPMVEVAGGFRALTVDAGTHEIATRFLPWTFVVGFAVTVLSWLLGVGWIACATFWRRRKASVTVAA